MNYNNDGSIDYETEDAGDCGMAPHPKSCNCAECELDRLHEEGITMHICKESTAMDDEIRALHSQVATLTKQKDAAIILSELQEKLLICYRLGKNPGSLLDKLPSAKAALLRDIEKELKS